MREEGSTGRRKGREEAADLWDREANAGTTGMAAGGSTWRRPEVAGEQGGAAHLHGWAAMAKMRERRGQAEEAPTALDLAKQGSSGTSGTRGWTREDGSIHLPAGPGANGGEGAAANHGCSWYKEGEA